MQLRHHLFLQMSDSRAPDRIFRRQLELTFFSQTSERSIEDFEEEVGVLFVGAHWRRETDRLSPESAFAEKQSHFFASLHHLGAFFLGRFLRLSIFHQLDSEHETFSADVADDVVLLLKLVQASENLVANRQ